MRTVGLVSLAIFLPIFVHAASLININTADAALLDTLQGIGPSKAAAIVDYRTKNGSFARIEDIQNVSGIGPSTYAGLAPFITVSDASTARALSTASTATSTENISATVGGTAYTPPPSALTLNVGGDVNALIDVPLELIAAVKTKNGAVDPSALIEWSFGDGSSSEGTVVEKTYHYAGTYLVAVTATDGAAIARDDFIITVRPAHVRILDISGDGITINNDSNDRLDLSNWRLTAGTGSFRIPRGTMLLPQSSVLFSSRITNLPIMTDAELLYPNGIMASRIAARTAGNGTNTNVLTQLSPGTASYEQVQAAPPPVVSRTESIISATTNIQSHEQEVGAPAAATELAAAGAVSPPQPSSIHGAAGIFTSPWTLGFLSVVALAGGAFIFL